MQFNFSHILLILVFAIFVRLYVRHKIVVWQIAEQRVHFYINFFTTV